MKELPLIFIFDALLCLLGVAMARRHKRLRWAIIFVVAAVAYAFAALVLGLAGESAWLPYPFIRSSNL